MRVWCAAALALFVVSGVQAGTAGEPEVSDPVGDPSGPGGVTCPASTCAGPPGFADLVKGWIAQEVDGEVVFRIDSANNANAYGTSRYEFHFEVAGTTYMAGLAAAQANTANGIPGSGAVTPLGVAATAAWVDTVITLTVPLSAIGEPGPGTAITGTYLTSRLQTQGQTTFTDRAPNAGFGLDYVLEGEALAVATTVHVNVTEGPLVHELAANTTTDASYAINWTGPANVTLAVDIAGNGTANITVWDPAGSVQFACACEGSVSNHELNGTAGVWRLQVNYTAFDGTASIRMQERLAAPVDAVPDVDGNGTIDGNGTVQPVDGTDEGAPMPLAVAVGAMIAAAVGRRAAKR